MSSQRNLKFHFFVSFCVLLLALVLRVPRTDVLFLLMAITLVVMAELMNTALEKAVDLAMPTRHPVAKTAKDVAAAAVFVTAVFAVAVGSVVFFDPIDRFFRHAGSPDNTFGTSLIWVLLALVALTVIVIETRFSDRGRMVRPSLFSAFSFAVSTLMTLLVWEAIVFLLSFSLSLLVMIVLYDKKRRGLPSLILGALIGTTITAVAYHLTTVG